MSWTCCDCNAGKASGKGDRCASCAAKVRMIHRDDMPRQRQIHHRYGPTPTPLAPAPLTPERVVVVDGVEYTVAWAGEEGLTRGGNSALDGEMRRIGRKGRIL